MHRPRLPRWLSALVLALFLGGGIGLPVADAAVFHSPPGAWHLGDSAIGTTESLPGHAAGCALIAGPTSVHFPAPCEDGRLVWSARIADVAFELPAAPHLHRTAFTAPARAPPLPA